MAAFSCRILLKRPADTVTVLFLAFLLALSVIFYDSLPKGAVLIGMYSALIAAQILLAAYRERGAILTVAHDIVFPLICVLLIFDSLEWVVHYVNPRDIDLILVEIDYLIFGHHPTIALESIMHPLLSDLLQLAYTTYYFIPVTLGIILLKKGKREPFERSLFLILFCFYLSYLGYILFPALGPRFAIDHLQTVPLQGFLVTEPIQDFLNRLEGVKRDAFPSGHTAVAVLILYCAYRYEKKFFLICFPIVTALVFSTVYLRYHYVVDVAAGLVLTVFCVIAGGRYYDWALRRNNRTPE